MARSVNLSASADRRAALVRTFEAICGNGPLPRAALRSAVNASPSTITTSVQELRARGLVVETGTGASTGGRRPKILDLAPKLGGVLAADVGGINIRAAAADLRGRILASTTVPTPTSTEPELLRETLSVALGGLRTRIDGPVRALAVAIAAVVHPASEEIFLAANIPGWRDVDLRQWLAEFDAPVLIENEANLAALGEHTTGGARNARHVLFVAIGAGIGAGLVLDGELFRGATGAAGEIGYLRTSLREPPAEFEREAGAAALVRRYEEHGGTVAEATAETVFARAASGEGAAEAAIAELIDQLALGIANAIVVVDPHLVVVGGGLAAAGDVLLKPLCARISTLVPVLPEIRLSELGPEAALAGAAWWAGLHARSALAVELERASVVG